MFQYGRGFRQVLILHRRRRAKFKLPHSHVQSLDGQSDQLHHIRRLKFLLPHTSQVQSSSSGFPPQPPCHSRCVPQPHHCVKRKFIEPQDLQAQQSRSTHSLAFVSPVSSELDELEAADPGPGTSDADSRILNGPRSLDADPRITTHELP